MALEPYAERYLQRLRLKAEALGLHPVTRFFFCFFLLFTLRILLLFRYLERIILFSI